jgi:hypothetical protein
MTGKENPIALDELYGLEPVIELGEEAGTRAEGLQSRSVQCPYCGESFDTVIDPSGGSTSYIEDCQVCCRPIEFRLEVADEGVSVQTGRSD